MGSILDQELPSHAVEEAFCTPLVAYGESRALDAPLLAPVELPYEIGWVVSSQDRRVWESAGREEVVRA